MKHWFAFQNEKVLGPFTTEQMRAMVTNGEISGEQRLWGQPMESWCLAKNWLDRLPALENRNRPSEIQEWYFALNGDSFGPFNRATLITELKAHRRANDVMIWTKGMKAWSPIFEFYDLMDAIGINRRAFPRAEIEGRVTIKSGDQVAIGVLEVIGEGGFGAVGLQGLQSGQVISAEIHSKSFPETLHVKAEIRDFTDNGYMGCRFIQISMESKSAIIQYVRQRLQTNVTRLKAA